MIQSFRLPAELLVCQAVARVALWNYEFRLSVRTVRMFCTAVLLETLLRLELEELFIAQNRSSRKGTTLIQASYLRVIIDRN